MRDGGRLRLLWRWLLVGAVLDWLLVLMLFATVHLGGDSAGMDIILLPFVMLVSAWMVHVVALPHFFGRKDGALSPAILFYKGGRFWIAAALISTAAGFGGMFAGINILYWAAYIYSGEALLGPLVLMLCLSLVAAPGLVAGLRLHQMRPQGGVLNNPAPWRPRSDMIGGASATTIVCGALYIYGGTNLIAAAGFPQLQGFPIAALTSLQRDLLLASLGTVGLLPHLVLLGFDLRRAARARSGVAAVPAT